MVDLSSVSIMVAVVSAAVGAIFIHLEKQTTENSNVKDKGIVAPEVMNTL